MARKVKQLTVRALLEKFMKVTEESRTTESGMYPVHSVVTRYKGLNFIGLLSQYFQVDKAAAIKKIQAAVAADEIFQVPAKRGYLLFLESKTPRKKKDNSNVLKEILS